MVKRYKCGDVFPLDFGDGQSVETGEEFERDFEKTSGVEHERWLTQLGHIQEVVPATQVTKVPVRQTAPTQEE